MAEKSAKPRKTKKTAEKEKPKTARKTVKKAAKKPLKSAKKSVKVAPKSNDNKTAGRKGRADSTDVAIEVAQQAFREIEPPSNYKLTKAQMQTWDNVIAEAAKIDWSEHMIEMAAMLTCAMHEVAEATKKLRKEGATLERKQIVPAKDGAPAKVVVTGIYKNPIAAHLKQEREAVISLRRSLGIHSRALEGEARDAGARRAAHMGIENAVKGDDDDDLFNKPIG